MANNKVVALRGEPIVDEQLTASTAITPGHLIEVNAGQWRPHDTATGAAEPWFALERDEVGKDYDDAYAADDRVKAGFFHQGQRVNALVASGEDLAIGDLLESAGGGLLTEGNTNPVARAAEAVVTTAETRVAVIVI
jgi:hypothetical protein